MFVNRCSIVICWAIIFSLVTANAQIAGASNNLRAIREIFPSKSKRDTVYKNTTSLDKSWDGAVLFTYQTEVEQKNVSLTAGIQITCTRCYVLGTAIASFTISGNFNATQEFQNFTSNIENDVDTLIIQLVNDTEIYVEDVVQALGHDLTDVLNGDFSSDDLTNFTISSDLWLDLPDIPECLLSVQFDGLELYVEIDTTLSAGATYNLNLFTSKSEFGVSVEDQFIGVIFTIDLILSVEAEIDISSGFHIMLNDGAEINIPMFSQNVSTVTFNGGKFEFLPVTIQSGDVVLTAILRVGAHAGFNVGTPSFDVLEVFTLSASSGVEVGIWADIAQFITNVTLAPNGSTSGCELSVEEVYIMNIGANAGATLAIDTHTWGPTPNTTIPIFYTTLASACAITSSSSIPASTKSAHLTARAASDTGLTTKTISTTVTYTGTACISTGLLNCPVSLQTTSKYTSTISLVTAVSSGVTATFPATTQTSVASTIAFGAKANSLVATSGAPISYTPPPASSSIITGGSVGATGGIAGVIDGKTGGVSNKIIIGVSIGVGVLVLLAIIAGCIFCFKRKTYSSVKQRGEIFYVEGNSPYTPASEAWTPKPGRGSPRFQVPRKKAPNVSVSEFPY